MSEPEEPEGYYYPVGDIELQKGWQLGQKALFLATRLVSTRSWQRAKDLANEALQFLSENTVPTDQYYIDNIIIITEFARILQILSDIDVSTSYLNSDAVMSMHYPASTLLNNFQHLKQDYFFYKKKNDYNPFTVRSRLKPGNTSRKKKHKEDWRDIDGLWINKVDDEGKAIYALKGKDHITRHFNEDNVVVERRSDGKWYQVEQYDVGPRWYGEQLYADPLLRWNYGLPPNYNIKKQEAIDQWHMRQQAAAQQQAYQQQAGPSWPPYPGQGPGPSWQPYPGQGPGPSWPPYPGQGPGTNWQAWGQGRRRYKSRRVKIPRQRRKTNRKNKTIRKK